MLRKINKGREPNALTIWKKQHPHQRYHDLDDTMRRAIRQALLEEQYYLCAYCCQRISIDKCHNEHLEAQHDNPQHTLDYNNLLASCNDTHQCGIAHKTQPLPLTPLMPACETELNFKLSGRVEGLTSRAKESIRVLNLGDYERNNKALIEKRKQLSESLLWENGVVPHEGLEDEELLLMLIDDLSTAHNKQLQPYAPVVVNILRGWLQ